MAAPSCAQGCEVARHGANIEWCCNLGFLQDGGEKIREGCFTFVGAARSVRCESVTPHRTFLQTHLHSAIVHVIFYGLLQRKSFHVGICGGQSDTGTGFSSSSSFSSVSTIP